MNAKERELGLSSSVALYAIERNASKRIANAIFVIEARAPDKELRGVAKKLREALKQVSDISKVQQELYNYINNKDNHIGGE